MLLRIPVQDRIMLKGEFGIMNIFTEDTLNHKLKKVVDDFESERFNSAMVQALISNASEIIAPYWSLKTFIAVNPLKGFEDRHFLEAAKQARKYFGADCFLKKTKYLELYDKKEITHSALQENFERSIEDILLDIRVSDKDICLKKVFWEILLSKESEFKILANPSIYPYSRRIENGDLLDRINNYMIKFFNHFFDEGIAVWQMPNREKGFYAAWKALAIHDSELKLDKHLRKWLKQLPDCPEKALIVLLESLAVNKDDWEEYLRASLAALPGWASFIKWRHLYAHIPEYKKSPASKLEYLTVRLCVETIFLFNYSRMNNLQLSASGDLEPETSLFTDEKLKAALNLFLEREPLIWLSAWEDSFQQPIVDSIYANHQKFLLNSRSINNSSKAKHLAQMIFCIDVRSEGIRRCIEADSRIETLGFAGFFGLPISYKEYDSTEFKDACPVLIRPKHFIDEQVHSSCSHRIEQYEYSNSLFKMVFNVYKALKTSIASAFVFAEASGALYMLNMMIQTLTPALNVALRKMLNKFKLRMFFEPILEVKAKQSTVAENVTGLAKKEQLLFSEMALRLMGLTQNFAPLVLFCGHGSTTENNPYASALDCGACAGNHGGVNAKALAKILNQAEIRLELFKRGIMIPESTVFIGAEHNTTTDDFEFYDYELNNDEHIRLLADLKESLIQAKKENNLIRQLSFLSPSSLHNKINPNQVISSIEKRSMNWSELRPEWGLAGNTCFIIGPRSLTKGIDLSNRAFLHSYDWTQDSSGLLLETIMTAPMIVTQWINSQYYFSTVDNVNFGSGSKITHNIVGNFGVMQGNASDLFTGLPLQSVMSADNELYHRPLRLRVLIFAPMERVKKIISKNTILQKLFYNEWIRLVVLDPKELNKNEKFV